MESEVNTKLTNSIRIIYDMNEVETKAIDTHIDDFRKFFNVSYLTGLEFYSPDELKDWDFIYFNIPHISQIVIKYDNLVKSIYRMDLVFKPYDNPDATIVKIISHDICEKVINYCEKERKKREKK